MTELNYTTLKDIKMFLQTLNIYWLGKMYNKETEQSATINDFKHIVTLKVYTDFPQKENIKKLNIQVSDKNFFILSNVNEDIHNVDHSLRWQAYMIEHKDNDYAKYIYNKCVTERKEKEASYDKKINLILKMSQNLQYQKALEMAKLNTTLLNATCKLCNFAICDIDTLFNKQLETAQ